jgi:tetratricopeptide (TPR) repeat protein
MAETPQARMRRLLVDHFSEEDLESLYFDLGVNYDSLPGEGTEAKSRELIAYMQRRKRTTELLETVRRRQPDVEWPASLPEGSLVAAGGPHWLAWLLATPARWLPAAAGLMAVVLVIALLAGRPEPAQPVVADGQLTATTQQPAATAEPAEPTAAEPTATLTPTASPTAAPPPDVLISEFDAPAEANVRVARRLEQNLLDTLAEQGLTGINVTVFDEPVTSRDQAQALAASTGSKVVVYGWYDDLGVNVRIYVAGGQLAGEGLLRTREMPLAGDDTATELGLVVRETLPENVTFLSLFIIGHLYYENNEYQSGRLAFDAAQANLPETAALDNEALIYFFQARALDMANSDDLESVVCGYLRAIDLDPAFFAAYTNLGIVLAENQSSGWLDPDWPCLAELGYDELPPAEVILSRALFLEPDSAVVHYNYLATQWDRIDPFWLSTLQDDLLDIIVAEPDLVGPRLMLGNLYFRRAQWQPALRQYEHAQRLLEPDPAALLVNLGQAHRQLGDPAAAEAQFLAALDRAPDDPEAMLALAGLAQDQGNTAGAAGYLAQIPAFSERYDAAYLGQEPPPAEVYGPSNGVGAPEYMADIFKAYLAYEAGATVAAETALTGLIAESGRVVTDTWNVLVGEHDPYLTYLVGLLQLEQGRPEVAQTTWQAVFFNDIGISEFDLQGENSSTLLAFELLLDQCGAPDELIPSGALPGEWYLFPLPEIVATWGEDGQCLPTDVPQRVEAIWQLFLDQLAWRLNFQSRGVTYYGLACPYVYTFDPAAGRWQMATTILTGHLGPGAERLDRRPLAHFDGRLLIREVEPEVSYIDQLYIVVVDGRGRETILRPALAELAAADGRYLVLVQGDELLLHFPGFAALVDVSTVYVAARGYYMPLRP